MKIRNLELKKNSVKICVPITSTTERDILDELIEIKKTHAHLVEWRCDFYEYCKDVDKVVETLKKMRIVLEDMPLIFTFRTVNEGGDVSITKAEYLLLYKTVLSSRMVDIVDIELYFDDDILNIVRSDAKAVDSKLILSNHDFEATPPVEVIKDRMQLMEVKGADIAKVAYMPKSESDVGMIVEALQSYEQSETLVIAISMGELGKITRLKAGEFGSCITFASSKSESAPGQIYVEDMFHLR